MTAFVQLSWAQRLRSFEMEANIGLTHPIGRFHNAVPDWGPAFGLEMRHNISGSNFDVGVRLLDISTAAYRFDGGGSQSNRTISLMVVGDYNFRPYSTVNPYVGGGVGVGGTEAVLQAVESPRSEGFVSHVRAGVELWYHLRIGGQVLFGRSGYSNACFTLGFVMGGHPQHDKLKR